MRSFLIITTLLFGVAQAGDRTAAFNKICKPMTIQNNIYACVSVVRNYIYFDNRGLGLCANIALDVDRILCLDIIGDKVYEQAEMDKCLSGVSESEKLDCLTDLGTYNPPQ